MYQILSLTQLLYSLCVWLPPRIEEKIHFYFFIHVYPVDENSTQSGSKPSDLDADSMLAHTQFCQLSLHFTSLPFTQHGNGQPTFCPCALLCLRILCSLPSLLFLRTDVDCPEPRIAFPEGPFALLQSFIS